MKSFTTRGAIAAALCALALTGCRSTEPDAAPKPSASASPAGPAVTFGEPDGTVREEDGVDSVMGPTCGYSTKSQTAYIVTRVTSTRPQETFKLRAAVVPDDSQRTPLKYSATMTIPGPSIDDDVVFSIPMPRKAWDPNRVGCSTEVLD